MLADVPRRRSPAAGGFDERQLRRRPRQRAVNPHARPGNQALFEERDDEVSDRRNRKHGDREWRPYIVTWPVDVTSRDHIKQNSLRKQMAKRLQCLWTNMNPLALRF